MSRKCECLNCEEVLEYSEEKVTGLCARHQKAIRSGLNIIAICWNCNSIIGIEPKGYKARKVFGTDVPKILFTKNCKNCEHGTSKFNWITVNLEKSTTAFVSPEGVLAKAVKHSNYSVGPSRKKGLPT